MPTHGNAQPTVPTPFAHYARAGCVYARTQSNMALPLVHSYTRDISRDAIVSGKYSNIRINGMEGNMNPFQPWATLKQALAVARLGLRCYERFPKQRASMADVLPELEALLADCEGA